MIISISMQSKILSQSYANGGWYVKSVLQQWYEQIKKQEREITAVYAFFNNDYSGYSPATVNKFKEIVGLAPAEIRPYQQSRLF